MVGPQAERKIEQSAGKDYRKQLDMSEKSLSCKL